MGRAPVAGIELARPWARPRAIYSMKHDVKEAPADKPAFLRREKAPLQKRKSNRCDYCVQMPRERKVETGTAQEVRSGDEVKGGKL